MYGGSETVSEGRDIRLTTSIEPTIAALIRRLEKQLNVSASTYIRGAIIRDLHARGLLSADTMVRMASMSTREFQSLVIYNANR